MRFGLLTLFVFVAVVAVWLAIWRAVDYRFAFVASCLPFGLLVYMIAKIGTRYGHPILAGTVTGLTLGLTAAFVVSGLLDQGPLVSVLKHLTTTGGVVGVACGIIAWWSHRRISAK